MISSIEHFVHRNLGQWLDTVTITMLCLLCVFLRFAIQRNSSRLPLPPGPKPVPILGNAHQLPDYMQHEALADWAKKYGDILHARVFRRHVIVLSSAKAAQALMEKRGSIYSARPRFTFLCDLCGLDYNLGFMGDPDRWPRHRKWFQYRYQVRRVLDTYGPVQTRETNRLLADILRDPDRFLTHIQRFAAALMLELGYARPVESANDEYVRKAGAVIQGMFEIGNPGTMLVDCFPILRFLPPWMPGASFKHTARQLRPRIEATVRSPFRTVMQQVADGTAKSSFATALIEEAQLGQALSEAEEKEMSGAVNALYIAGTDTTATVLSTFVLAITLYPHVLEKAQYEMDRVIGFERLPEVGDRPELPYLDCVLKEVYRWGCPVPLGIAHEVTEDDEYNGCFIPKGSTVLSNIWAMTRDEDVYEHSADFVPERFLGLDDARSQLMDPNKLVFGFGRRACPGRFLGDTTVWLAVANMAAALDIRKKNDSEGHEVTPPPAFRSGLVRHPAPFICDIRPRSDKAATLISSSNILHGL